MISRLADGTLVEASRDLLPHSIRSLSVFGHAWDAVFLTTQQARYRTFDAVRLLGWTQLTPWRKALIADVTSLARRRKQDARSDSAPRTLLHSFFHDENVPEDVVAADDAEATRIYSFVFEKPDWRGTRREFVKRRSRSTCPSSLPSGRRTFPPIPRSESRAYPAAMDITTFVLRDGANCFNFAKSRVLFFDGLTTWDEAVSGTYSRHEEPCRAELGGSVT